MQLTIAEYLWSDRLPKELNGLDKSRAMHNLGRLQAILELLCAKQRVAKLIWSHVKFSPRPNYWKSFVEWYFTELSLKFFLTEMDWEEWFVIVFHDFFIVSQEEYLLFNHESVCSAVDRIKKLREVM